MRIQLSVVLFFILILSTHSPVSAKSDVESDTNTDKKECIQQKDGTKDCSNLYIEVGKPTSSPQVNTVACSKYGCDGMNAYSAGCTVDYGVVAMNWIYNNKGSTIGYVQLWWSNTCQTNWARTVSYISKPWYIYATVVRDNNYNYTFDSGDTRKDRVVHGYESISPMVYSPYNPAQARGTLDENAVYAYHGITRWV